MSLHKEIDKATSEEDVMNLRNELQNIMIEFKNQNEMFNWIWDNRPHVSELTGASLLPKGHTQWHWQFAHVLPKGTYPKWKLNPNNVMIVLPEEHNNQERFKKFLDKKEELRREYYKLYYGKEF